MAGLTAALILSATSAAASADVQATHHLPGRSAVPAHDHGAATGPHVAASVAHARAVARAILASPHGLPRPIPKAPPRLHRTHPATACTDSWVGGSGSWSTAADWSTGAVPTSSDTACITAAGTYTVTLVGSQSASALTLGGGSGHQTLLVLGNPNTDSTLSLSAATGSKITAHGILELNSEIGGGHAELAGGPEVTLSNSGKVETLGALTDTDYIETNVVNAAGATVDITGASTSQGDDTSMTNNGTFTVAAAGNMTFSGYDFTQSGGAETGSPVVLYNDGNLVDSVGTGSFDQEGTGGLAGTIPVGQTVTIMGVTSVDSMMSLAGNVTNDGTLALESQNNGGHAELYYGGAVANTLTNNGTVETLDALTNTDYINASVVNAAAGTINIAGASTSQGDDTDMTNNGTFTVAGTGNMTFSGYDFTQSGGTETGSPVVLYNDGNLVDSVGTGSFDQEGTGGLAGTIPVGQTVTIMGVTSVDSMMSLAGNVTNDGTLALDSQTNGGHAELYYGGVIANTLTNNGTVETLDATTNTDYINANLVNAAAGTIDIAGASTNQGNDTTTTNNGTFAVANGASMSFNGGSGYTQSPKGTFSATVDANTGVSGMTGGTDKLAGTLTVTTVGSPASGNSYNVIGSASSVNGTFSAYNFGSTPYTVAYTPTAVTVTAP